MNEDRLHPNRRKFLSQVSVAGAATLAAGVVGVEPLLKTDSFLCSSRTEFQSKSKRLRQDSA